MSRPPHLTARDVRVALPDGRPLLDIPSLGIADERIGLIGPNGAGKSTLLHLLAGELAPASGQVRRAGRVALVRQSRTTAADATVADALGIGATLAILDRVEAGVGTPEDLAAVADAWDLPQRTALALDALGLGHLALTRPLADVSGGEATRLALAAEVLAAPDLLLLDEPTNDLDAASRARVRALVSDWPRGLVVATHDRALLRVVDRILLLEDGALRAYGGGWDAFVAQRDAERSALEREQANAKAELARARRKAQAVRARQAHRDAAGRRARATGSQPKLVLNAGRERSQGTGARLADRAERVVAEAEHRHDAARARLRERDALRMTLPLSGLAAGTVVVALRDVTAGPAPGLPLLAGVTLEVTGAERVAITGPNGAGKSTLLRLVAGQSAPLAGSVHRGVPLSRVAVLDQRAALLDAGETVLDAFVARHPRADREAVRAALARFGFRAGAALQPVRTLSGGERMRAALACVLGGETVPQCLVLDEPTNHLDLGHLEAVEAALRGYDGALVVASHDEAFLEAIGVGRLVEAGQWRRGGAG